MVTKPKYQRNVFIGLIYLALKHLGNQIDERIPFASLLKDVFKPSVGVHAWPDHSAYATGVPRGSRAAN